MTKDNAAAQWHEEKKTINCSAVENPEDSDNMQPKVRIRQGSSKCSTSACIWNISGILPHFEKPISVTEEFTSNKDKLLGKFSRRWQSIFPQTVSLGKQRWLTVSSLLHISKVSPLILLASQPYYQATNHETYLPLFLSFGAPGQQVSLAVTMEARLLVQS